MDFNDRLFLIFEKLKETDKINTYVDLADILDTNKAGISDLKSKRKKVSAENLNCMIISYPEINPEWLLTGKGSMFREAAEAQPSAVAGVGIPLVGIIGGITKCILRRGAKNQLSKFYVAFGRFVACF